MSATGGIIGSATFRAMMDAGLSQEQMLAIIEGLEADRKPVDRTNAERQARHRAKKSNGVTVTPAPPNDIYSNPPVPPVEDKSSTAPKGRRRAKVVSVQVPEWMPAEQWLAMVAMRERMHPKVQWSEDAAKGIISKISRLRDAGHCPTKLLEKAVVSSWRTVFEGDDTLASTPSAGKPLTEDEQRARHLSTAETYERIGRTEEAAEIRRRWATGPPRPIGDLVKRMNIGG